MAATGSHPSYQDLPLGAVSDGRRAGVRGQQFPHHSRLLLPTPCPTLEACSRGRSVRSSLPIADLGLLIPWTKKRGLSHFRVLNSGKSEEATVIQQMDLCTHKFCIHFSRALSLPAYPHPQNPGHGSRFKKIKLSAWG